MRHHRLELFLTAVFAAKLIVLLQLRDHPLLQGDVTLAAYRASPLYFAFLTGARALFRTFAAARVLQIVLGTAAVACVFAASRVWFGTRAAWLAALLATLTGLFSFYETVLLPEALAPFLTSASLALLARASVRTRLSAAVMIAGLTSTLCLAIALHGAVGVPPDGWTWLRLHPGEAAQVFAQKLRLLFNAAHVSTGHSYPFYAYDEGTLLALLFVGPWLLIPLGVVGLALGAVRADRRREYLVWLSFVPVYVLFAALSSVNEGYRLPLMVAFCISGGNAIDYLVFRVKEAAPRERAGGLLILIGVIALAFVANLPIAVEDGRAEERARMAEAMVVRDRIEDADAWAARAEAIHPRPAEVHLRVARLLVVHSRPAAALMHLQKAERRDPGNRDVALATGQTYLAAKLPNDAIPYLERALNAGVPVDVVGFDLARARAATGDRAGALQVLQGARPTSEDASAWQAHGRLALQLESPSLAAVFLTRAAALAPADAATHVDLAIALAGTGQIADARRHAEDALRLNPREERARDLLKLLK